jgi:hypothetical protein
MAYGNSFVYKNRHRTQIFTDINILANIKYQITIDFFPDEPKPNFIMDIINTLFPNTIAGSRRTLLIFSVITFLLVLGISLSRILYPYDIGQYEAGIWGPAGLISHGINPYDLTLTQNGPYVMSPYGVFYYAVVGLGFKIFGVQFWFARFISLLSVIVCIVCIGKIIGEITQNRHLAILGGFLFLSLFPVPFWIGVQRPDMLALALALVGMMLALTMTPQGRGSNIIFLILQSLFISAAILTRQTSILPVALISAWYLFNRRYLQLTSFLILTAGFLAFVSFLMNQSSNGGYIWQQYVMPSTVHKNFGLALSHLLSLMTTPTIWGAIFLAVLAWVIRGRKTADDASPGQDHRSTLPLRLFFAYFILSLLLSVVTSSRVGANLNYYLEFSAGLAMIVPLYLSSVANTVTPSRSYLYILIFILLSVSLQDVRIFRGEYYRWQALPYYREIVSVIEQKTDKQQPVFSYYPELAVAADRSYYFNDFVQYDGRAPKQHEIFQQVLKSGELGAIVTGYKDTPEGYYKYPLSTPDPQKYYTVYLFLKKPVK